MPYIKCPKKPTKPNPLNIEIYECAGSPSYAILNLYPFIKMGYTQMKLKALYNSSSGDPSYSTATDPTSSYTTFSSGTTVTLTNTNPFWVRIPTSSSGYPQYGVLSLYL